MRLLTRRCYCISALGLFLPAFSGCGTIMYPERKGQKSGPLNWKVVALDALGLLFFFIPGVIAFAVDFNNGTIYLPAEEYGDNNPKDRLNRSFTQISVPTDQLSRDKIEELVSKHTGREINLRDGEYQTHPLPSIDSFWSIQDKITKSS